MKRNAKKLASFLTAISLAATQLGVPPPAWGASAVLSPFEVSVSSGIQLQLPSELGTIQTQISGTGPLLVHLQTAHGNYDAQKKIRQILKHLYEAYGIRLLFVEGSAFKLRPELARFYPDRMDLTRGILDELAKKAYVKGPELFLAETPEAEAYGIEELETYVTNGKAFADVLSAQQVTETYLAGLDLQIERVTTPYLSKNLREFLKRVEVFEKNQLPLLEWLGELKILAQKHLEIDLTSPVQQIDWPMLLRIYTLQEFEARINPESLVRERKEFLKAVRRFVPGETLGAVERLLSGPVNRNALPDPETELLFERMVSFLPQNFNYQAYPNLNLFIGHLIVQSELKGERLFEEVEKLTDRISSALADGEAAKEAVVLLKDYRLLKRLLALELTPRDYEKVLERRETLQPEKFHERFEGLDKEKRVRGLNFADVGKIQPLFEKALGFYAGAKARDRWLTENLVGKMQELGAAKAVVVTGGFHAEPFKKFFSERGFSYALISPALTDPEGGAAALEEGREAYLESVLNTRLDDKEARTSTWESVPFVATGRAELREMGVDERKVVPVVVGAHWKILSREKIVRSPRFDLPLEFNKTAYAREYGLLDLARELTSGPTLPQADTTFQLADGTTVTSGRLPVVPVARSETRALPNSVAERVSKIEAFAKSASLEDLYFLHKTHGVGYSHLQEVPRKMAKVFGEKKTREVHTIIQELHLWPAFEERIEEHAKRIFDWMNTADLNTINYVAKIMSSVQTDHEVEYDWVEKTGAKKSLMGKTGNDWPYRQVKKIIPEEIVKAFGTNSASLIRYVLNYLFHDKKSSEKLLERKRVLMNYPRPLRPEDQISILLEHVFGEEQKAKKDPFLQNDRWPRNLGDYQIGIESRGDESIKIYFVKRGRELLPRSEFEVIEAYREGRRWVDPLYYDETPQLSEEEYKEVRKFGFQVIDPRSGRKTGIKQLEPTEVVIDTGGRHQVRFEYRALFSLKEELGLKPDETLEPFIKLYRLPSEGERDPEIWKAIQALLASKAEDPARVEAMAAFFRKPESATLHMLAALNEVSGSREAELLHSAMALLSRAEVHSAPTGLSTLQSLKRSASRAEVRAGEEGERSPSSLAVAEETDRWLREGQPNTVAIFGADRPLEIRFNGFRWSDQAPLRRQAVILLVGPKSEPAIMVARNGSPEWASSRGLGLLLDADQPSLLSDPKSGKEFRMRVKNFQPVVSEIEPAKAAVTISLEPLPSPQKVVETAAVDAASSSEGYRTTLGEMLIAAKDRLGPEGFTAGQLKSLGFKSASALIARAYTGDYVDRRETISGGRAVFLYRLTEKGEGFVASQRRLKPSAERKEVSEEEILSAVAQKLDKNRFTTNELQALGFEEPRPAILKAMRLGYLKRAGFSWRNHIFKLTPKGLQFLASKGVQIPPTPRKSSVPPVQKGPQRAKSFQLKVGKGELLGQDRDGRKWTVYPLTEARWTQKALVALFEAAHLRRFAELFSQKGHPRNYDWPVLLALADEKTGNKEKIVALLLRDSDSAYQIIDFQMYPEVPYTVYAHLDARKHSRAVSYRGFKDTVLFPAEIKFLEGRSKRHPNTFDVMIEPRRSEVRMGVEEAQKILKVVENQKGAWVFEAREDLAFQPVFDAMSALMEVSPSDLIGGWLVNVGPNQTSRPFSLMEAHTYSDVVKEGEEIRATKKPSPPPPASVPASQGSDSGVRPSEVSSSVQAKDSKAQARSWISTLREGRSRPEELEGAASALAYHSKFYGEDAELTADAVLALLAVLERHREPEAAGVREDVLWALEEIGPRTRKIVPTVTEALFKIALSDSSSFVRTKSWQVLVKFYAEDVERILKSGNQAAFAPEDQRALLITYKNLKPEDPKRQQIFDALLIQNKGLTLEIARRKAKQEQDRQDYAQEGILALRKAIKRFDFSRGEDFASYAGTVIRRTIQRYAAGSRKGMAIPPYALSLLHEANQAVEEWKDLYHKEPTRQEWDEIVLRLAFEKEIEKAKEQWLKENGREPSEAELAQIKAEAALSPEIEERIQDFHKTVRRTLQAATLRHISDEESSLDESVPQTSFLEPARNLEELPGIREEEAMARYQEVLRRLSPQETVILKLRNGVGTKERKSYELKEIARLLGVTRQRVHQIEARAKEKAQSKSLEERNRIKEIPAGILDHTDVFLFEEYGIVADEEILSLKRKLIERRIRALLGKGATLQQLKDEPRLILGENVRKILQKKKGSLLVPVDRNGRFKLNGGTYRLGPEFAGKIVIATYDESTGKFVVRTDTEKPASPESAPPVTRSEVRKASGVSRRTFLGGIGAAAAAVFFSPRPVEAQEIRITKMDDLVARAEAYAEKAFVRQEKVGIPELDNLDAAKAAGIRGAEVFNTVTRVVLAGPRKETDWRALKIYRETKRNSGGYREFSFDSSLVDYSGAGLAAAPDKKGQYWVDLSFQGSAPENPGHLPVLYNADGNAYERDTSLGTRGDQMILAASFRPFVQQGSLGSEENFPELREIFVATPAPEKQVIYQIIENEDAVMLRQVELTFKKGETLRKVSGVLIPRKGKKITAEMNVGMGVSSMLVSKERFDSDAVKVTYANGQTEAYPIPEPEAAAVTKDFTHPKNGSPVAWSIEQRTTKKKPSYFISNVRWTLKGKPLPTKTKVTVHPSRNPNDDNVVVATTLAPEKPIEGRDRLFFSYDVSVKAATEAPVQKTPEKKEETKAGPKEEVKIVSEPGVVRQEGIAADKVKEVKREAGFGFIYEKGGGDFGGAYVELELAETEKRVPSWKWSPIEGRAPPKQINVKIEDPRDGKLLLEKALTVNLKEEAKIALPANTPKRFRLVLINEAKRLGTLNESVGLIAESFSASRSEARSSEDEMGEDEKRRIATRIAKELLDQVPELGSSLDILGVLSGSDTVPENVMLKIKKILESHKKYGVPTSIEEVRSGKADAKFILLIHRALGEESNARRFREEIKMSEQWTRFSILVVYKEEEVTLTIEFERNPSPRTGLSDWSSDQAKSFAEMLKRFVERYRQEGKLENLIKGILEGRKTMVELNRTELVEGLSGWDVYFEDRIPDGQKFMVMASGATIIPLTGTFQVRKFDSPRSEVHSAPIGPSTPQSRRLANWNGARAEVRAEATEGEAVDYARLVHSLEGKTLEDLRQLPAVRRKEVVLGFGEETKLKLRFGKAEISTQHQRRFLVLTSSDKQRVEFLYLPRLLARLTLHDERDQLFINGRRYTFTPARKKGILRIEEVQEKQGIELEAEIEEVRGETTYAVGLADLAKGLRKIQPNFYEAVSEMLTPARRSEVRSKAPTTPPKKEQTAQGLKELEVYKPAAYQDRKFVKLLFTSEDSPLSEEEKELIDLRYGLMKYNRVRSLEEVARSAGKSTVNVYLELPALLKRIDQKAESFLKAQSKDSLPLSRSEVRSVEAPHSVQVPLEAFEEALLSAFFSQVAQQGERIASVLGLDQSKVEAADDSIRIDFRNPVEVVEGSEKKTVLVGTVVSISKVEVKVQKEEEAEEKTEPAIKVTEAFFNKKGTHQTDEVTFAPGVVIMNLHGEGPLLEAPILYRRPVEGIRFERVKRDLGEKAIFVLLNHDTLEKIKQSEWLLTQVEFRPSEAKIPGASGRSEVRSEDEEGARLEQHMETQPPNSLPVRDLRKILGYGKRKRSLAAAELQVAIGKVDRKIPEAWAEVTQTIPDLIAALVDSDPFVRPYAAETLVFIGKDALHALRQARKQKKAGEKSLTDPFETEKFERDIKDIMEKIQPPGEGTADIGNGQQVQIEVEKLFDPNSSEKTVVTVRIIWVGGKRGEQGEVNREVYGEPSISRLLSVRGQDIADDLAAQIEKLEQKPGEKINFTENFGALKYLSDFVEGKLTADGIRDRLSGKFAAESGTTRREKETDEPLDPELAGLWANLERGLDTRDPVEQSIGARQLGELGSKAIAATDLLKRALKEADTEIKRQEAGKPRTAHDDAWEALKKIYPGRKERLQLQIDISDDEESGIYVIPYSDEDVVENIESLGDPDVEIRTKAAQVLGRVYANTPTGSGDTSTISIRNAMFRFEPALAALIKALSDEDPTVRETVALSLGQIGPAAQTAIPALARVFAEDPEGFVRDAAVAAVLGSEGNPEDIVKIKIRGIDREGILWGKARETAEDLLKKRVEELIEKKAELQNLLHLQELAKGTKRESDLSPTDRVALQEGFQVGLLSGQALLTRSGIDSSKLKFAIRKLNAIKERIDAAYKAEDYDALKLLKLLYDSQQPLDLDRGQEQVIAEFDLLRSQIFPGIPLRQLLHRIISSARLDEITEELRKKREADGEAVRHAIEQVDSAMLQILERLLAARGLGKDTGHFVSGDFQASEPLKEFEALLPQSVKERSDFSLGKLLQQTVGADGIAEIKTQRIREEKEVRGKIDKTSLGTLRLLASIYDGQEFSDLKDDQKKLFEEFVSSLSEELRKRLEKISLVLLLHRTIDRKSISDRISHLSKEVIKAVVQEAIDKADLPTLRVTRRVVKFLFRFPDDAREHAEAKPHLRRDEIPRFSQFEEAVRSKLPEPLNELTLEAILARAGVEPPELNTEVGLREGEIIKESVPQAIEKADLPTLRALGLLFTESRPPYSALQANFERELPELIRPSADLFLQSILERAGFGKDVLLSRITKMENEIIKREVPKAVESASSIDLLTALSRVLEVPGSVAFDSNEFRLVEAFRTSLDTRLRTLSAIDLLRRAGITAEALSAQRVKLRRNQLIHDTVRGIVEPIDTLDTLRKLQIALREPAVKPSESEPEELKTLRAKLDPEIAGVSWRELLEGAKITDEEFTAWISIEKEALEDRVLSRAIPSRIAESDPLTLLDLVQTLKEPAREPSESDPETVRNFQAGLNAVIRKYAIRTLLERAGVTEDGLLIVIRTRRGLPETYTEKEIREFERRAREDFELSGAFTLSDFENREKSLSQLAQDLNHSGPLTAKALRQTELDRRREADRVGHTGPLVFSEIQKTRQNLERRAREVGFILRPGQQLTALAVRFQEKKIQEEADRFGHSYASVDELKFDEVRKTREDRLKRGREVGYNTVPEKFKMDSLQDAVGRLRRKADRVGHVYQSDEELTENKVNETLNKGLKEGEKIGYIVSPDLFSAREMASRLELLRQRAVRVGHPVTSVDQLTLNGVNESERVLQKRADALDPLVLKLAGYQGTLEVEVVEQAEDLKEIVGQVKKVDRETRKSILKEITARVASKLNPPEPPAPPVSDSGRDTARSEVRMTTRRVLAGREDEIVKKYIRANLEAKDRGIIRDMVKEYDYRSDAEVAPTPKAWFLLGLTWAKMALKGREDLDPLMRTVVLARDARKIEPEIIEAIAAALLVAGFQVIYIGGKRPNSAASFEWALREYRPLLGIFVTTNHQRDSEEAKIRGARVSLQDEEGRIRNLTREQIRESLSLLGAHLTQGFMRNKERLIQDFETTSPGRIIEESVDLNSVRANVLIGLVAGGSTPKTLYDLARELEDPGKPALEVLSEWERTAGDEKPLAGLKIAIDGAHTPSGPLAQKTFEGLGAEVELVHAEVKEILETDRADPSQEGNLIPLKKRMQEKGIQLGLAFDINGDRGDLILRTGENQFVRILADNLTQVLIPYLLREGGYDPRKIGPVAVIRDILSSRGVDEVARRNRLSVHITDSGYVFLNEKANQLRKEGIIPLIRVERSGHLWLDVLGDFENPIVVATLFALASLRHQKENRESTNPFSEIYLKGVVSHRQSARFQLPFHPKFLKELSSDPRNTNGYAYEPGARPSQNLIALGRHVAVEKALQFLDRNKLFVTPAGLLKVGQIETQKDVADNLFRYLVVPFFNGREDYVGRFVLRASANEPAFVVSFETPVRREKGETPEAEFIQDRYTAVGGIVLDFLEGAEFAEVSGEAGTTLSTYRRSVRRSEARAGTPAERLPRRLARGLLRSEVRIVASVYKNRILPTWEAYSPGVRRLAVRLFLGPEVLAATGVLSPSLPRLSPEEISSLGPVQPMLSASSQTKRRIFDYRSLPDRPETLDSVLLYALYHREVGYKLLAVASPEQVRNLMNEVRRYVESRYRTSLPPNFQIIALPSPEALIPTLHDLVSEANTPAGFISEEGKVAAKIAYRRGLLRVAGSSDPSVQNATALLAAERLQGDLPFAFYLHVLTGRDLDLKNRWDELVAFLRAREALLRAA